MVNKLLEENASMMIENDDMRKLYLDILKDMPDYIAEVPSSITGKHHPIQDFGFGGLCRHMWCVGKLVDWKLGLQYYRDIFSSKERDCMRIAALVHDGRKNGPDNGDGHSVHEHPLLMAKAVSAFSHTYPELRKEIDLIASLISTHMGQWNTSKDGKVVLPVPTTEMQMIVHEADYIASQKETTLTVPDVGLNKNDVEISEPLCVDPEVNDSSFSESKSDVSDKGSEKPVEPYKNCKEVWNDLDNVVTIKEMNAILRKANMSNIGKWEVNTIAHGFRTIQRVYHKSINGIETVFKNFCFVDFLINQEEMKKDGEKHQLLGWLGKSQIKILDTSIVKELELHQSVTIMDRSNMNIFYRYNVLYVAEDGSKATLRIVRNIPTKECFGTVSDCLNDLKNTVL